MAVSRPPSRVRRRTVRATTLSLALTGAILATGPAIAGGDPSGSGNPQPAGRGAKPTVVLVHGAFADASGWNGVAGRLMDRGYEVVAPPNPLRGVLGDSAYVASILKSIKGPIVLAGHSYGGAVISQAAAGNKNVKALVYVSAFMPDVGESPASLSAKFTGSELAPALRPVPYTDGTTSGTDLYIQNDKFHAVFAADLPQARARLMAIEQRPVAQAGFGQKATAAAWKKIPSWFVVARNDKAIAPNLERFEARRAKSHTVEVDSSHVAMISHPDLVTDQIRAAAHATAGR
ncbi:short chain dehydrogenase [Streptomyces sp. ADI96-02]|uniref:alpha/beta fold hydrolase n=1 Tax=unclassified Streptomyces TaxID=2593676 RepID=UPI000F54E385|nr:alpha/beta hydrolase [Streptomyces sp. ADI96-02]RPK67735.1 short chain dehydrogenase [Streptomyces sp. ADI96-02]